MKKNKYIQIRINDQLKKDFQSILKDQNQNMTEVLTYAITHAVADMQSPYTHKCMGVERTNKPHDFYAITDLNEIPELKALLLEFEYSTNHQHACITDECLLAVYNQLLSTNQLHLLFEWRAFQYSVENGFEDGNQ